MEFNFIQYLELIVNQSSWLECSIDCKADYYIV